MTSVWNDIGHVDRAPGFRRPAPVARYECVRDLGDEGWEAEIRKADGKAIWILRATREAAITAARNWVAAENGRRK